MNIKKYTYRLDAIKLNILDTDDIDSIALHHSENPTMGIDDITDWHMDGNKWSWNGYGYMVMLNGDVWDIRGYTYVNSAVKDNNSHIVSICFQGDYSKNTMMPTVQLLAGVELIKELRVKFPKIKTVAGHNYWNNSECPGNYFPLVNIIQRAEEVKMNIEEAFKVLVDNKVIESPDYWLKVLAIIKFFDMFVINCAKKIVELKG